MSHGTRWRSRIMQSSFTLRYAVMTPVNPCAPLSPIEPTHPGAPDTPCAPACPAWAPPEDNAQPRPVRGCAEAQRLWSASDTPAMLEKVAQQLSRGAFNRQYDDADTQAPADLVALKREGERFHDAAMHDYTIPRFALSLSKDVPRTVLIEAEQAYRPGWSMTALEQAFLFARIALHERAGFCTDRAMIVLTEAMLDGRAGSLALMQMTYTNADQSTLGRHTLLIAGASRLPARVDECHWKDLSIDVGPGAQLIDPWLRRFFGLRKAGEPPLRQASKARWKKEFAAALNAVVTRKSIINPGNCCLADNSRVSLWPLLYVGSDGLTGKTSFGTRRAHVDDLARLPPALHALWREEVAYHPRRKLVDLVPCLDFMDAFAGWDGHKLYLLFDIYDVPNADLRYTDVLQRLVETQEGKVLVAAALCAPEALVITVGEAPAMAGGHALSERATVNDPPPTTHGRDGIRQVWIAPDKVCFSGFHAFVRLLCEALGHAAGIDATTLGTAVAAIEAALPGDTLDPRKFYDGLDPRLALPRSRAGVSRS